MKPTVMRLGSAGIFLGGIVLFGCKSQAQKECEQLVKTAEVTLLSMNPTDRASVEGTLAEVKKALSSCEAVKSKEVSEIKAAVGNVERHLLRLKKGEIKPPPPPPGAQELARMEKEGDPDCPRGQGYQHPVLKKFIRCKGPLMVERTYAEVQSYFAKHRIATATKDGMLRGVQAGVTYTFTYDAPGSKNAPVCLTIESSKDKKVTELIAFATDIEPSKIDPTQPVVVAGTSIPVQVTQGEMQTVVLGDCTKKTPMIVPAVAFDPASSGGPAGIGGPVASAAPGSALAPGN